MCYVSDGGDRMDQIVKMHNKLGKARYELSRTEQVIFIYAVKHIDQEKKEFNEVEFKIEDIAAAAKLNVNAIYNGIDEMTTNLMRIVIKTDRTDGKKGWIKYNLTQKCEHIEKEGVIKFKFNKDMIPLLLDLKEYYFLQSPAVIEFKGKHSVRLYDFIKSMAYNKTEYLIEIEELKEMLNCGSGYKVWGNFKDRVIEPSKVEINDKSDIKIDYKMIKRGRKAHSILFTFTRNKDVKKKEYEYVSDVYDIDAIKSKTGINNEMFNNGEVLELYEIAVSKIENTSYDVYEYMKACHEYMNSHIEEDAGKARRLGYFKRSLEESWGINLEQLRLF